ncbi:MAG: T9SS type A sorting domain-containing protein [Bacteroidetes bacterium]|nr:T9SS type A sorting domain-containing protein [Bacteroidota bacterium]
MKTFIKVISISTISMVSVMQAQYCSLPGRTAYSTNQPGITKFTLDSISRTSLGVENTSKVVVNTGLSTTLVRGKTYTVNITHSKDAVVFPTVKNNIRVWIDYNQNSVLDDANETVISADEQTPGVFTKTFTVPLTATLGSTRLRATAKMGTGGGHTIPTACDNPADPLGYHGEMEDYTVKIAAATTGINEFDFSSINGKIFPNPFTSSSTLSYSLSEPSNVLIEVYNVLGEKATIGGSEMQSEGTHTLTIDNDYLPKGSNIYFVRIVVGDKMMTQKLIHVN